MINVIAELGINHQGDMVMQKIVVQILAKDKREPKDYLSEEQYNMPYDNINSFGNA